MCNCNTPPCSKCNNGQPCNCPPDYTVTPAPSACKCCPNGFYFQGASPNWPNGICLNTNNAAITTPPIPCITCETAITTDCVVYSGDIQIDCGIKPGNVYGINPGDSLTTIINKMCILNKNVIEGILSQIGLDSDLASGLCQLVQNCPSSGSGTTPIITSIIITFP